MRFPTNATTNIWQWWSITTVVGWCGRPRAATPARGRFFNTLGAERCAQITHVSADAADWIADVVLTGTQDEHDGGIGGEDVGV